MIIAPFPWVGGKRRIAHEVWQRFGDVDSYIEPFYGSGAVHLARPDWHIHRREVVGDLSCYVINAWRSIAWAYRETAYWADWPISHFDLTARRNWLMAWADKHRRHFLSSPFYHHPQAAGFWIWGTSCWIGESSYCASSSKRRAPVNRRQVRKGKIPHITEPHGVNAARAGSVGKRPAIGSNHGIFADGNCPKVGAGNGGARKAGVGTRPQIIGMPGVNAIGTIPRLTERNGVHAYGGVTGQGARLMPWFQAISARLRQVHLLHGDWRQCVASPSALGVRAGMPSVAGVFLDPPYAIAERTARLYDTDADGNGLAQDVQDWAIANGDNPRLRIALCAGRNGLDMPPDWTVYQWQTAGHVEGGRDRTEFVYFSPACLPVAQARLL